MNILPNKSKTLGLAKNAVTVLLMLLLLSLSACSSMVSIAPSTTPITAKDTYTKLGYTKGKAFGMNILGILPLFEASPSRVARNSAIEKGGGNAMIEVTEDYHCFSIILIYFFWTTVEGTAVQVEHKGMEVE